MTRAVIKLSGDISGDMRVIAAAIKSAAYNQDVQVLAFRYKDWRVIIDPEEIRILDLKTEADAKEVMDYLRGVAGK